VEPPFRCDYGEQTHVADGFFADIGCVVPGVYRIEVGRNCLVGPGVHAYTATHPVDADERTSGREYGAPVTVGDDVWLGGRCLLTPGVAVGDRAVVGAGAVVTLDVPDDVVEAGTPARVVRELE
jgi:maltose O-acetyltransferase